MMISELKKDMMKNRVKLFDVVDFFYKLREQITDLVITTTDITQDKVFLLFE